MLTARVCSTSLQKQHEVMQAQLRACDEVKGLPIADVIELKKTIVELLNEGESVPAGLRRLGGKTSQSAGVCTELYINRQMEVPVAYIKYLARLCRAAEEIF